MTQRLGAVRATPPEITVIVLTFNHERFVRRTILSILDQLIDVDVEVVVHDDASTDATAEILRGLHADHPDRLSLILQSENQLTQGVGRFADLVLDAESPYIALCEGDDLWTDPTKLKRQHDFMLANPWCSMSHHGVAVLNEGGDSEFEQTLASVLTHADRAQTRVPGVELAKGNFIMTCAVMFRRDALREDILRESAGVLGDLILFAVVAEAGDIGYLPEVMAMYRLHSSNIWSGRTADERRAIEMEVRWFLASHLKGDMQLAFQDALLEILHTHPVAGQHPSIARRTKEHSDVLRAYGERDDALRELEGSYKELDRTYGELAGEYRELGATLRELASSRDGLILQLEQTAEQVRATQAELIVAAADSAALRHALAEVWESRSWAVTRPLRAAKAARARLGRGRSI